MQNLVIEVLRSLYVVEFRNSCLESNGDRVDGANDSAHIMGNNAYDCYLFVAKRNSQLKQEGRKGLLRSL